MKYVKNIKFGVIHLDGMGNHFSLCALGKKLQVIAYSKERSSFCPTQRGMIYTDSLFSFVKNLKRPRKIFIFHLKNIEYVLQDLAKYLDEDDIIIDSGISDWKDILRYGQRFYFDNKVHYIDLSIMASISNHQCGMSFMVGGNPQAVKKIESILKIMSISNQYTYTGSVGTAHFAKSVYDAMELSMLQAIGEGVNLLDNFSNKINRINILHAWRNHSVTRSWLLDLIDKVYKDKNAVHLKEKNPLINDAFGLEIFAPVISHAVMQLFSSKHEKKYWSMRIEQMSNKLNNQFRLQKKYKGKINDFLIND